MQTRDWCYLTAVIGILLAVAVHDNVFGPVAGVLLGSFMVVTTITIVKLIDEGF